MLKGPALREGVADLLRYADINNMLGISFLRTLVPLRACPRRSRRPAFLSQQPQATTNSACKDTSLLLTRGTPPLCPVSSSHDTIVVEWSSQPARSVGDVEGEDHVCEEF